MSDGNCDNRLLRIQEAAARLTVDVRTVWRMIAAHELAVVRMGHCTRIQESDIRDYIERHRK